MDIAVMPIVGLLLGKSAMRFWALIISAVGIPCFSWAADAPPRAPVLAANSSFSYDPTHFEVRGGGFASTWGPEGGTPDINGELVFPKIYSVPGWQDVLIPRFHMGGMANLAGRTNYAYAGALWTLNYDRYFAEYFFGGVVHDGPLKAANEHEPNLGCRELYHIGGSLGYRFDQNWSAMVTFDHASDGEPTLSRCHSNTGISVVGLRIGYSF
jgi:lipid A 3-O-deacylase